MFIKITKDNYYVFDYAETLNSVMQFLVTNKGFYYRGFDLDRMSREFDEHRAIYIYGGSNKFVSSMTVRNQSAPRVVKISKGDTVYFEIGDIYDRRNYFSLSALKKCDDESVLMLAKKSSMYGLIMADGYIFNPYIHRRFLPKQFIENFESFDDYLSKITVDKAIKYVIKEIEILSFLQSADKDSLLERRKFFTFNTIRSVLNFAIDEFLSNIEVRRWTILGNISEETKTELTKSYEEAKVKIAGCNRYSDLNDVVKQYFATFPKFGRGYFMYHTSVNTNLEMFRSAFKASGAYYTMKHLIMFEGYLFKDMTQQQSLDYLGSLQINGDLLFDEFVKIFNINNADKSHKDTRALGI